MIKKPSQNTISIYLCFFVVIFVVMGNCYAKRKQTAELVGTGTPSPSPVTEAIQKSLSQDESLASESVRTGSDESGSSRRRNKKAVVAHRVISIMVPGVAKRQCWMHLPAGIGLWWQFEEEAQIKDTNTELDRSLITALLLRARAISLGYVVTIHMPYDLNAKGIARMAEVVYDEQAALNDMVEVSATIEIRAEKSVNRLRQAEEIGKMVSVFGMHPLTEIEDRKIYLECPSERKACSFDLLKSDVIAFLDNLNSLQ
jgi:hypothetical protein